MESLIYQPGGSAYIYKTHNMEQLIAIVWEKRKMDNSDKYLMEL